MWLNTGFHHQYGATAAIIQQPVIQILVFGCRRAKLCSMPIGWPWQDLFRSANVTVTDMHVITSWERANFTLCVQPNLRSNEKQTQLFYMWKWGRNAPLWSCRTSFFFSPLRGFSLKVFIFKDQVQAQPYVIYLSKKSKRDRLGREIMKDFLWKLLLRKESSIEAWKCCDLPRSVKRSPISQSNHCLSF